MGYTHSSSYRCWESELGTSSIHGKHSSILSCPDPRSLMQQLVVPIMTSCALCGHPIAVQRKEAWAGEEQLVDTSVFPSVEELTKPRLPILTVKSQIRVNHDHDEGSFSSICPAFCIKSLHTLYSIKLPPYGTQTITTLLLPSFQ